MKTPNVFSKIKSAPPRRETWILIGGYLVISLALAATLWSAALFYFFVLEERRVEVSTEEVPLLTEEDIGGAIKILDERERKLKEILGG